MDSLATRHARPEIEPRPAGLDRLFDLERRLEQRIAAEEQAAQDRIAAAQQRAKALAERAEALRIEAEAEERRELDAHQARLAAIAKKAHQRVKQLGRVSDEDVDRWAERLLAGAAYGRRK